MASFCNENSLQSAFQIVIDLYFCVTIKSIMDPSIYRQLCNRGVQYLLMQYASA